ncbi:hypothetical protein RI367_003272 [Sorochytrium milnesiophthora]
MLRQGIRPLSLLAKRPPVGTLALRGTSSSSPFEPPKTEYTRDQVKQMRPLSPHITIYQPQLTWYLSGLHRATGVAPTVVLYGGGLLSLVGFGSTELVNMAAALPYPLFAAGKFAVVFPAVFHSLNGVRHLVWDTGRALELRGVYRTGYAVMLGTALVTAGLLAL